MKKFISKEHILQEQAKAFNRQTAKEDGTRGKNRRKNKLAKRSRVYNMKKAKGKV